jgi:hypothetical protein
MHKDVLKAGGADDRAEDRLGTRQPPGIQRVYRLMFQTAQP